MEFGSKWLGSQSLSAARVCKCKTVVQGKLRLYLLQFALAPKSCFARQAPSMLLQQLLTQEKACCCATTFRMLGASAAGLIGSHSGGYAVPLCHQSAPCRRQLSLLLDMLHVLLASNKQAYHEPSYQVLSRSHQECCTRRRGRSGEIPACHVDDLLLHVGNQNAQPPLLVWTRQ